MVITCLPATVQTPSRLSAMRQVSSIAGDRGVHSVQISDSLKRILGDGADVFMRVEIDGS